MNEIQKYLTEFLDSLKEEFQLPGFDCSVYIHHKEAFRHMGGYADIGKNKPITKNTLYNIYSSTKFITCTAALQLLERGKIRLDDNVSRYFPEMGNMKVKTPGGEIVDAQRQIKVKDAFTMSTGVTSGSREFVADFIRETNGKCRPVDLPKYMARIPLNFEPTTKFEYGISHEILAAIIEKVTDMHFEDYLQENIFKPLGMENTSFYIDKLNEDDLAMQYGYQGKDAPPKEEGCRNALVPPFLIESASGGLITCVDDYMKFLEAMNKGNIILRKPTIDLMRTDHLNDAQKVDYGWTPYGMSYGLGVRVVKDQGKMGNVSGYTNFGWDGAAGCFASVDPEKEISIFYAQHMFGTPDHFINSTIRNIVYAFAE